MFISRRARCIAIVDRAVFGRRVGHRFSIWMMLLLVGVVWHGDVEHHLSPVFIQLFEGILVCLVMRLPVDFSGWCLFVRCSASHTPTYALDSGSCSNLLSPIHQPDSF
jgi:hypothetical protein